MLGEKVVKISPESIEVSTHGHQSITEWRVVKSIEETSAYFFVFIDNLLAYIIPKNSFKDKDGLEQFKNLMFELDL